jgi:hypothetical protein
MFREKLSCAGDYSIKKGQFAMMGIISAVS